MASGKDAPQPDDGKDGGLGGDAPGGIHAGVEKDALGGTCWRGGCCRGAGGKSSGGGGGCSGEGAPGWHGDAAKGALAVNPARSGQGPPGAAAEAVVAPPGGAGGPAPGRGQRGREATGTGTATRAAAGGRSGERWPCSAGR